MKAALPVLRAHHPVHLLLAICRPCFLNLNALALHCPYTSLPGISETEVDGQSLNIKLERIKDAMVMASSGLQHFYCRPTTTCASFMVAMCIM